MDEAMQSLERYATVMERIAITLDALLVETRVTNVLLGMIAASLGPPESRSDTALRVARDIATGTDGRD